MPAPATSSTAEPAAGQPLVDAASATEMQPLDRIRAANVTSTQQRPGNFVNIHEQPIEVDDEDSEEDDDDEAPLHTIPPTSLLPTPSGSHPERAAFFAERAQLLLQRHGLSTTLSRHERLDPARPNRVSKAHKHQKPKMALRCRGCGKTRRSQTGTCPHCKNDKGHASPTEGSSSAATQSVQEGKRRQQQEADIEKPGISEALTSEPQRDQLHQRGQESIPSQEDTCEVEERSHGGIQHTGGVPGLKELMARARAACREDPAGASIPAQPGPAGKEASTEHSSDHPFGGAYNPRLKGDLPRVHREIRVRVKYTCEQCGTTFAADDRCRQCGHQRCANCIRDLDRHASRSQLSLQQSMVPDQAIPDQAMPGASPEYEPGAPTQ